MADQLYFDFKIYHYLTSFSWNYICLTSASSSKKASLRCCIYRQVKRDIQLYKYNISTRLSIFKFELYIRLDPENLRQSDLKKMRS